MTKEQIIHNFAAYCLKHKSYSVEQLAKPFFESLAEDDKNVFITCWELCIGSGEAVQNAPKDIQDDVLRLS